MALYDDRGFWKRAQIAPSNLALAGVAEFADLDRLTIFADNLVPHVLRCAGVLRLRRRASPRTSTPGGRCAPARRSARSARAPSTPASCCPQRTGLAPRELDVRLWTRGQDPAIKARPRHRCRCVRRTDGQPPAGSVGPCTGGAAAATCAGASGCAGELGEAASSSSAQPRPRQLADRVGDRVGQVDPVGVGALGPLCRRPSTTCPGLPTTVLFGGTSLMTTLLAPIFAPWPTVIGPSSFAPEPIVTLSSTVGWRLPVAKPVPPSVTPW